MSESKPPESRVSLAIRIFCALPMFLVLTVIFWEVVLGTWLLSGWLYETGWPGFGLAARVVAMLLGLLTVFMTVRVVLAWMIMLVRIIRGRET